MNPVEGVIYQLRNAKLNKWPFPHVYVENIFNWEFYDALMANLPPDDTYKPLPGGYKSRLASDVVPNAVKPLLGPYFMREVLATFHDQFWERFPHPHERPARFSSEIRFIRDSEGYAIGPHTDAPRKVVSMLFYLPADLGLSAHGTSIYVPDDHEKICPGGPHYKTEGFSEVFRAPYWPNSMFAFWKTDNSWHGVEKICEEIRRDVMLYNIYAE